MSIINMLLAWLKSLSLEESLILIFILFLLCEWVIGRLHKLNLHNLKDSYRNTMTGLISLVADFMFTVLTLPIWIYMFSEIRIFEFNQHGGWMFVVLFVLIDFSEYWFHRLSHEINLLWSAHSVHHQSNYFNLTVGLRTSFFVPFFDVFFYSIFPLIGFDPENVMMVILIQGIYQLLIHTKLIGKLGVLEYIIVTPSSHRVHHGKNAIYMDKNYGKFLIVWDQLFGTYQAETQPVEYGISHPLRHQGVWFSILEPFRKLLKTVMKTKDKKTRRTLLFKNPSVAHSVLCKQDEYSVEMKE